MKRGVELSMHEEGTTMLRRERNQTHPICHASSYHLCLSTSLTVLHYSGSCWQKDEQSSRKKIDWKNIDSGRPRRSKEPRGGASALIIFNIIQRYKINQSSPQWTGRVRNTAAQCSYIILVHG